MIELSEDGNWCYKDDDKVQLFKKIQRLQTRLQTRPRRKPVDLLRSSLISSSMRTASGTARTLAMC